MPGIEGSLAVGAAPGQARVLCIFVHGRTQTPEDMVAAVIGRLATPGVAYALPRAAERCWYHALAVDPRSAATQAELARSLADLAGLVRDLRAAAPSMPLLLAGFSQGACLALEHGFGGQDSPAALAALTGCRVGVAGDARPSQLAAGLPVYLTAGRADPWIPLDAFAGAMVELGRGGARLRADVFPDRGHEVAPAEIAMLDGMLADLAAGRSPRLEAPR